MKYGFLFLLLAIAIGVAAFRGGPWAWLLFYPAFSFGVVAAAYLFSAPGVFGKRFDGRRSVDCKLQNDHFKSKIDDSAQLSTSNH